MHSEAPKCLRFYFITLTLHSKQCQQYYSPRVVRKKFSFPVRAIPIQTKICSRLLFRFQEKCHPQMVMLNRRFNEFKWILNIILFIKWNENQNFDLIAVVDFIYDSIVILNSIHWSIHWIYVIQFMKFIIETKGQISN